MNSPSKSPTKYKVDNSEKSIITDAKILPANKIDKKTLMSQINSVKKERSDYLAGLMRSPKNNGKDLKEKIDDNSLTNNSNTTKNQENKSDNQYKAYSPSPSKKKDYLQSLKDKIFSPGDFTTTKNNESKNKKLLELSKKLYDSSNFLSKNTNNSISDNNNSISTNNNNNISININKNKLSNNNLTSGANSSLLSNTQNIKYLPDKKYFNQNKKTLILDLDETLVHSAFKPFYCSSDIVINITFEDKPQTIHVLKRPYVDEFLDTMSKYFELVIFTASISEYANPLLDRLDTHRRISYRLFRQHCIPNNKYFIKDLRKIGRDLKNTIIIDNNPISYALNRDNGIPIITWINNKNDIELKNLIPFLVYLSNVNDVRECIKKVTNGNYINYREINKMITSSANNINSDNIKDSNKNSDDDNKGVKASNHCKFKLNFIGFDQEKDEKKTKINEQQNIPCLFQDFEDKENKVKEKSIFTNNKNTNILKGLKYLSEPYSNLSKKNSNEFLSNNNSNNNTNNKNFQSNNLNKESNIKEVNIKNYNSNNNFNSSKLSLSSNNSSKEKNNNRINEKNIIDKEQDSSLNTDSTFHTSNGYNSLTNGIKSLKPGFSGYYFDDKIKLKETGEKIRNSLYFNFDISQSKNLFEDKVYQERYNNFYEEKSGPQSRQTNDFYDTNSDNDEDNSNLYSSSKPKLFGNLCKTQKELIVYPSNNYNTPSKKDKNFSNSKNINNLFSNRLNQLQNESSTFNKNNKINNSILGKNTKTLNHNFFRNENKSNQPLLFSPVEKAEFELGSNHLSILNSPVSHLKNNNLHKMIYENNDEQNLGQQKLNLFKDKRTFSFNGDDDAEDNDISSGNDFFSQRQFSSVI